MWAARSHAPTLDRRDRGDIKCRHKHGRSNGACSPLRARRYRQRMSGSRREEHRLPDSLEPTDRIDALVTAAMETQHLASVSIGVRRQGQPDILRSYGFADLENDVPATPRAVYRIGSLTKTFTAAVVMGLVER